MSVITHFPIHSRVIVPQIPVLMGDIRDQPGVITADYVREVALFGPMVEVRSGYRSVH